MTRLVISREVLPRFGRLDAAVQNRITELVTKFQDLTVSELYNYKGLHLESYVNQRDSRARTIRLGDNHRGIVLLPDDNETVVLIDVLPHQEADRWMARNEFRVNQATGALEIVDVASLGELVSDGSKGIPIDDLPNLYAHRSDREFQQLGIEPELLPLLRALQTEEQLEPLLTVVPQGQADALILLTGTESTDILYATLVGDEERPSIDTEDLVAAIAAPASRNQFHVVSDQEELAEMLAKPFALWRTYLHPTQQKAAYKPVYNGPARVTGGAGTGKTVVAIHRAKMLAESLEVGYRGKPILFTTYTRNLAQSIKHDLVFLGGVDLLDSVEVLNVDRLAYQVVTDEEGAAPGVVDGDRFREIWQKTIDEIGAEFQVTFAIQEWEQVVLAQGIESRSEYFAAVRAGRGKALDRLSRAKLWKVIEAATAELARRKQRTYLQIASDAAGYLTNNPVKAFRHVIVDEAQDLHEAQWRLLRAAVKPDVNDLFIVGDSHQRIYDRRSSLSKVGIEIRGRSRRLRINYRTTHEILRWSLAVLGEGDFDDLDLGTETQDGAGYHSFLHGASPTVAGFDTPAEMAAGLVSQVALWIEGGVEPSEIGVVTPTKFGFSLLEQALQQASLTCFRLGRDLKIGEGIAVGTMHRMKGLEYRCIAVAGVGVDQMPLQTALAAVADDPAEVELELRRQRCLLYVACTRAREDLWVGYSGDPSPFIVS